MFFFFLLIGEFALLWLATMDFPLRYLINIQSKISLTGTNLVNGWQRAVEQPWTCHFTIVNYSFNLQIAPDTPETKNESEFLSLLCLLTAFSKQFLILITAKLINST